MVYASFLLLKKYIYVSSLASSDKYKFVRNEWTKKQQETKQGIIPQQIGLETANTKNHHKHPNSKLETKINVVCPHKGTANYSVLSHEPSAVILLWDIVSMHTQLFFWRQ